MSMKQSDACPRRLPPGPHGIPPELVERNQRERLIAAMAEVCGENGYGGTRSPMCRDTRASPPAASTVSSKTSGSACWSASKSCLGGCWRRSSALARLSRRRRQKRRFAPPRACCRRSAHRAAAHSGDRHRREGGRAAPARGDRAAVRLAAGSSPARRRWARPGPRRRVGRGRRNGRLGGQAGC